MCQFQEVTMSSNHRLPPLLALRAFEAAGRRLSFTLASQELFLTQGAISRQIRQLEDSLEQKLFVRLTRRIELTEAGREYLTAVQQALGIIESATRKCRVGEQRVLTIDILPTLGSFWLMPRLASFSDRYPEIELRVVSSIEPANMQNKEIDVAIKVGRLPGKRYDPSCPQVDLELTSNWRGVHAYPMFDDVLVPVMSRMLTQMGTPIREAKDLLQFRLIDNITRKSAWKDWLGCQGIKTYDPSMTLNYGHFFMTLQAAREGKGIALIPRVIFKSLSEHDNLVCPIDPDIHSAGEYCLLTREETKPDPAVATLRDWLLREAAEYNASHSDSGNCANRGAPEQTTRHGTDGYRFAARSIA